MSTSLFTRILLAAIAPLNCIDKYLCAITYYMCINWVGLQSEIVAHSGGTLEGCLFSH